MTSNPTRSLSRVHKTACRVKIDAWLDAISNLTDQASLQTNTHFCDVRTSLRASTVVRGCQIVYSSIVCSRFEIYALTPTFKRERKRVRVWDHSSREDVQK